MRFCGKAPEEVSEADVQRWKERLVEEGYAASTMRTFLATVKSFFQTATELNLVKANPVQAGMLPKMKRYESGRYLSEAEEAKLLAAIDVQTGWGRRDYALILFLLRSGRKAEEILGLRWGDFVVRKDGVEAGGERVDWDVWAAIWRYLEGCGRLEGIKDQDAVFAPLTDACGRVERLYGEDWQNHELAAGSVGRSIQMYAGWAGLAATEITPKALRYTAGRRKWKSGCSLAELGRFLGHSDVETTRLWVKSLEAGAGQKGAAYRSKRRKRGAKPGNSNADVLSRYLVNMLTTEGLDETIQPSGSVQLELAMMRQALRKLFDEAMKVPNIDAAVKTVNVMGAACMRMARLMESERAGEVNGEW